MPRYLRWIAAMTAGITGYFTYTALTFGIARANGVDELHGGVAGLVALGAYIVTMLAVLGTNDYLAKRYGLSAADRPIQKQEPDREPVDQ
jgi:hypothetical protein